jgi:hypothetical protein
MLKLPAVVTREIDGFLPAADAVKRNRKLSAGEINHFLYKPVAAKLPPKPPANIGDLVMGPKGRAFVRSIDVENQTMSLKAVMGSGTTRKTPWAQVSGKIAV